MGSLGTPSVAALTTITFIATITVLTAGWVTQCHLVLDAVLDVARGHHAMLSHLASLSHRRGSVGTWAPGLALGVTFTFPKAAMPLARLSLPPRLPS